MQKTVQIILLSMCLGVALAGTPLSMSARTEMSLMQLMMSSRETTQGNPARSMECFDYYVPILNEITNEYEASFKRCLTDADSSRKEIDNSHSSERDTLHEAGQHSCDLLDNCSKQANSLSSFACYSDAGSENARIMFTISANASELYTIVLEEYRVVENDQFRCTNASERAYVENTANTYTELNRCLMGLSPVPTTTTPTTVPSEDTTPEVTTPEVTTPEVTTPEVTTTEATTPEVTTEPVETTTPPPEAIVSREILDLVALRKPLRGNI